MDDAEIVLPGGIRIANLPDIRFDNPFSIAPGQEATLVAAVCIGLFVAAVVVYTNHQGEKHQVSPKQDDLSDIPYPETVSGFAVIDAIGRLPDTLLSFWRETTNIES